MARRGYDYARPVRRLVIAVLAVMLLAVFLFWRIDSPRAERIRMGFVDRFVPSMDWMMAPVTQGVRMVAGFQSYARLYEQNQELRRELQKMAALQDIAARLKQENDRLLAQNQVRIDPALTSITGQVLTDSGTVFRQSVLLNVGARDGIIDGWAVMDAMGIAGRISGVGRKTSRVILLTDPTSRLPVTIEPGGQHALLTGDNSPFPYLDFIERPEDVRPSDRVSTSGDGGVFPSGFLVGHVVRGSDGRLRARLAADYGRLHFLRVLRSHAADPLDDASALIPPFMTPLPALPSADAGADPVDPADPAATDAAAGADADSVDDGGNDGDAGAGSGGRVLDATPPPARP